MPLIPPFLKNGDRIALISTARYVEPEVISYTSRLLQDAGFEVLCAPYALSRHNQFAGTDAERNSDLNWAVAHPGVRAVFCTRGGYGTARLLNSVDWTPLAKFPKWFAGFSDITALHQHLNLELGMASIHSTMPVNLLPESGFYHPDNLESLLDVLNGRCRSIDLGFDMSDGPYPKVSGRLVGGNLSVLYSMLGSVDWSRCGKIILVLEDVDEYLYHIDRMMLNLERNHILRRCSAILTGGFTRVHDNEIPFGMDAESIVREFASPYGIPVLVGGHFGHVLRNIAFPLGLETVLQSGVLHFDYPGNQSMVID